MYTIKRAAQLTGISVPTLRAWERRYGVVTPRRTESGYRVYDDEAVRTLKLMNTLVDDGWAPALAAEEVARRHTSDDASASPVAHSVDLDTPQLDAKPPSSAYDIEEAENAFAALDLVPAAQTMDAASVAAVLDQAFSTASFEVVVDEWLMPALRRLGEAWADGRVSVAGEHLVAHGVQRRLAGALEAAGHASDRGPRVVIGLPPGGRHELGLFAFAVAARRAGLDVSYLGADLPAADWAAARIQRRTDAAVLAVSRESDLAALHEVVESLRRADRSPTSGLIIAVGGAHQEQAPEHCLRLGHRIGPAARRLAAALRV